MNPGFITMSAREIDRLSIIERVNRKELSQTEAAKLLKITDRHVRRLLKNYLKHGPQGLISKKRGKRSNNRLSIELLEQCRQLLKSTYAGFGPTLAHEKLTERHGLVISVESVRNLMMQEGLWKGKKRKQPRVHQSRPRRTQLGELIQLDGSPHAWFEGRGPSCCLLVYIDDATSKLMHLRFVDVESTDNYFQATKQYIQQHGRPLAFYPDKHSVFRVNLKEAASGSGETQFGRAMRELDIDLICANSPQAKGRVERANGVLQDRLVKELRLRNISDIQTANGFLPEFIKDYNRRFSKEPANSIDAHRSSIPEETVLDLILSSQFTRKVSKNLEVSYNNKIYQIQMDTPGYAMRGATVTVVDDGRNVTLLYKKRKLTYIIYNKENKPAVIKNPKEMAQNKQRHKSNPGQNHPWKKYPATQKSYSNNRATA